MRSSRSGLTLADSVVVVVCTAIVIGLWIPPITAARETSRVNQCGVRVKNLALASIQHEMVKGHFPGWVDRFGVFISGPDPSDRYNHGNQPVASHVKVGGYGVALLPWLDAQPTYEHWTDDRYPVIHHGGTAAQFAPSAPVGVSNAGAGYHRLAAPNLPNFQCPSNPVVDAQSGRNSYITNNGMCYFRTSAAAKAGGGVSAGLVHSQADAQSHSNGIFVARYQPLPTPAGFGTGPDVSLGDIKDGQSLTALISENVQALPWHFAGFLNGIGPTPNLLTTDPTLSEDLAWTDVNRSNEFNFSQFTSGMVWHFEDPRANQIGALSIKSPTGLEVASDQYSQHKINGRGSSSSQDIVTLQMDVNNCADLARPSSAHTGGVNMGFADGGHRFISETIDYRVYQAILTPNGSASDVPDPAHLFTEADLNSATRMPPIDISAGGGRYIIEPAIIVILGLLAALLLLRRLRPTVGNGQST